jgi:magnesium chelatase family protein
MLARRLRTILLDMTRAEAIYTTRLPRVAGLSSGRTALVTSRPFRAPHQAIADVGRIDAESVRGRPIAGPIRPRLR